MWNAMRTACLYCTSVRLYVCCTCGQSIAAGNNPPQNGCASTNTISDPRPLKLTTQLPLREPLRGHLDMRLLAHKAHGKTSHPHPCRVIVLDAGRYLR